MSYTVSEEDFEKLVKNAIDAIPELYKTKLENVAFFVEVEPSQEQRNKLRLRPCDSLFGLFEGVPKTKNDGGYAFTLPSKITVFKKAHEDNSADEEQLRKLVIETIWHEVAHYYGLSHEQMKQLQQK